ncbi:hypothetical protein J4433_01510 [Candidatus Pacearchaeota archaeon]|nr:hypothetical protein [Candidatus Pacearchaeota archaeon]
MVTETSAQQKARDYDLESKLSGIVSDFKNRLAEGEISCKPGLNREYFDYIESILKKSGISNNTSGGIGYMTAILENKLGIKRISGIKRDYFVRETTPLSESAREDMGEYDKLKKEVGSYLKDVVGQSEILAENFKRIIEGYVSRRLSPDSAEYKIFIPKMLGTYESQFNVVTPERKFGHKIGDYWSRDIKKALEQILI